MAIAFTGAADLLNNGGTTNTYTKAYTVGAGSNLLLVGLIGDLSIFGNDDITGITYAGVSMTLWKKCITGISATTRNSYLYALLNPATGANNVIISCTSNHYLIAVAADYSGVKTTGQPDATAIHTEVSLTSTSTGAVTTITDNDWVVLVSEGYDANKAPTAGAGSTRRAFDAAFGTLGLFDSNGVVTPPGSYSMTVNYPDVTTSQIDLILAAFAPSGAAPAAKPSTLPLLGAGRLIVPWYMAEAVRRNLKLTRRSTLKPWRWMG
jgi:hypothetical protein